MIGIVIAFNPLPRGSTVIEDAEHSERCETALWVLRRPCVPAFPISAVVAREGSVARLLSAAFLTPTIYAPVRFKLATAGSPGRSGFILIVALCRAAPVFPLGYFTGVSIAGVSFAGRVVVPSLLFWSPGLLLLLSDFRRFPRCARRLARCFPMSLRC